MSFSQGLLSGYQVGSGILDRQDRLKQQGIDNDMRERAMGIQEAQEGRTQQQYEFGNDIAARTREFTELDLNQYGQNVKTQGETKAVIDEITKAGSVPALLARPNGNHVMNLAAKKSTRLADKVDPTGNWKFNGYIPAGDGSKSFIMALIDGNGQQSIFTEDRGSNEGTPQKFTDEDIAASALDGLQSSGQLSDPKTIQYARDAGFDVEGSLGLIEGDFVKSFQDRASLHNVKMFNKNDPRKPSGKQLNDGKVRPKSKAPIAAAGATSAGDFSGLQEAVVSEGQDIVNPSVLGQIGDYIGNDFNEAAATTGAIANRLGASGPTQEFIDEVKLAEQQAQAGRNVANAKVNRMLSGTAPPRVQSEEELREAVVAAKMAARAKDAQSYNEVLGAAKDRDQAFFADNVDPILDGIGGAIGSAVDSASASVSDTLGGIGNYFDKGLERKARVEAEAAESGRGLVPHIIEDIRGEALNATSNAPVIPFVQATSKIASKAKENFEFLFGKSKEEDKETTKANASSDPAIQKQGADKIAADIGQKTPAERTRLGTHDVAKAVKQISTSTTQARRTPTPRQKAIATRLRFNGLLSAKAHETYLQTGRFSYADVAAAEMENRNRISAVRNQIAKAKYIQSVGKEQAKIDETQYNTVKGSMAQALTNTLVNSPSWRSLSENSDGAIKLDKTAEAIVDSITSDPGVLRVLGLESKFDFNATHGELFGRFMEAEGKRQLRAPTSDGWFSQGKDGNPFYVSEAASAFKKWHSQVQK